MVAARIHGPEALGQGAAATPDAITPSSHGWRMMLAMRLRQLGLGKEARQKDRRWKLIMPATADPHTITFVQLKLGAHLRLGPDKSLNSLLGLTIRLREALAMAEMLCLELFDDVPDMEIDRRFGNS